MGTLDPDPRRCIIMTLIIYKVHLSSEEQSKALEHNSMPVLAYFCLDFYKAAQGAIPISNFA